VTRTKRSIGRRAVAAPVSIPQLSDIGPDPVKIFEFDRFELVLVLRRLRGAIEEGAVELEMVARERVFIELLSRALTQSAQQLYRLSKDLNQLIRALERAHAPKPTGRP
jgi:hypothetical protein